MADPFPAFESFHPFTRLNRLLAESLPVDEIFVVAPMGDDGLVIGGALQYLLDRDGLPAWLARRYRLGNVYWGGGHDERVPAVFGGTKSPATVSSPEAEAIL